jgi:PAS domain S-box-containing protein
MLQTLKDLRHNLEVSSGLRRSEEKYRDLIEISPDAIYVVDANGICLLGNRAGAELAGVPEDELVGTPVTDTYLPEERQLFFERLEKIKIWRHSALREEICPKKRRGRSRGSFRHSDTRRVLPGYLTRHQQAQPGILCAVIHASTRSLPQPKPPADDSIAEKTRWFRSGGP